MIHKFIRRILWHLVTDWILIVGCLILFSNTFLLTDISFIIARAHSHQAKVNVKPTKIEEQAKKIKGKHFKHKKFSLPLSFDVNGR